MVHKFNEDDFNFSIYPTEGLFQLTIKWYEEVYFKHWDNDKFLIFIENIKKNKQCQFSYKVDGVCPNTWLFDGESLHINIWDCGRIYDKGILEIDNYYMDKLQKIHDEIYKLYYADDTASNESDNDIISNELNDD